MLAFALVLLTASADSAPRAARLLDDAPLVAQVSPAPVVPAPEVSDAQVSVQQLQVDIDALRRQRPNLGAGIAFTVSGGGVALFGGFFLFMAAITSAFVPVTANPLFIIGIAGLVIAAPFVVIGVWLLVNRIEERNRIDAELTQLRRQLDQKLREQPPAPRRPAPGTYPVPQVLDVPPPPSLVLATF